MDALLRERADSAKVQRFSLAKLGIRLTRQVLSRISTSSAPQSLRRATCTEYKRTRRRLAAKRCEEVQCEESGQRSNLQAPLVARFSLTPPGAYGCGLRGLVRSFVSRLTGQGVCT